MTQPALMSTHCIPIRRPPFLLPPPPGTPDGPSPSGIPLEERWRAERVELELAALGPRSYARRHLHMNDIKVWTGGDHIVLPDDMTNVREFNLEEELRFFQRLIAPNTAISDRSVREQQAAR